MMDDDLESQAGICGGDVVQKLIRVLADERLLVIAGWKDDKKNRKETYYVGNDFQLTHQHHAGMFKLRGKKQKFGL